MGGHTAFYRGRRLRSLVEPLDADRLFFGFRGSDFHFFRSYVHSASSACISKQGYGWASSRNLGLCRRTLVVFEAPLRLACFPNFRVSDGCL